MNAPKILSVAAALATLSFSMAQAQVDDKASFISEARKICINTLMQRPQLVAGLELFGSGLEQLCACQAPIFLSELTSEEFASVRNGQNDPDITLKFGRATRMCVLSAISNSP